jgi:hypothetical protein
VEPERPAAELPDVPAAPDVAPDVPDAPAPDEPELPALEPLPIVASVRMNDAPPAAPDCDADPAAPDGALDPDAPLLPLPLPPARCRHPVSVIVPAWLP